MSLRPMRIAVDAMGGDLGPEEVVRGVIRAARERVDSACLILVGDQAIINAELGRSRNLPSNIVVRHAIATPIPSTKETVVLLDAGANVDCNANQLVEFALMGQCYSRCVLGKKQPTVGLLSNGQEDTKGNELTKEAHPLLKKHIDHFKGNVEGRDIFRGTVDVCVCD